MNNIRLEKFLQGLLDRTRLCYDEVMKGNCSAYDWNEEQEWEELPCPDGKAEAIVIFSTIFRHSTLLARWESEDGKDGKACAEISVGYDECTEPQWDACSIERGVEGSVSIILNELIAELNGEV